MGNDLNHSTLAERLLARTGAWYPIIAIVTAQLAIGLLGLALAVVSLQTNMAVSTPQPQQLAKIVGVLFSSRNILLILATYIFDRQVFYRLKVKASSKEKNLDTGDEKLAWAQITSLSWRYVLASLGLTYAIALPITLITLGKSGGLDTPHSINLALGSIPLGLGLSVLEYYLIELLLGPALKLLQPQQNKTQLEYQKGISVFCKTLLTTIFLVVIAVFVILLVGYRISLTVVSSGITSQVFLKSTQLQLIGLGGGMLLFGTILAYVFAHSSSSQIKQLTANIKHMQKENVLARVQTSATDEVGELVAYYNQYIETCIELQNTIDQRVASQTKLLGSILEVERLSRTSCHPDEIIAQAVNLIAERFNCYLAALFVKDSSNLWAELKDGSGSMGDELKKRGYKLVLVGKSLVCRAIISGQPYVTLDSSKSKTQNDNLLLQNTRTELAFPLYMGGQVFGALNLHSSQTNAFSQEEIKYLQGMADQLALTLEKAYQYKELEEALASPRDKSLPNSGEMLNPLEKTASLNVPLTLHLVEAVASQAALADENARLVKETRQHVERERSLGQATARIRETLDIDTILKTSARELRQIFSLDRAEVRLQLPAKIKRKGKTDPK